MKSMWALAFILLAGAVRAHPAVPATLPPAVYADTEVSTNIPFTAALNVSGRFSFNLLCWATPSNNVEVAFGTDANTNGVLDLEEIGRVVGWDCGSWFTRRGADVAYVAASMESTNDVRTFSWRLHVGPGGEPSCLDAAADDQPVFTDLPHAATYSPSWNLLRLTGRGLDASLETFTVSVTPDGTMFIMR